MRHLTASERLALLHMVEACGAAEVLRTVTNLAEECDIPIEREPDNDPPLERCCFCRNRTKYWTVLASRKPGEQVACCESCAKEHKPSEVPTKHAWCEKERKLNPTIAGRPYYQMD